MGKRWYAVQHGSDTASDYGSTVKREAMKMARQLHKDYPGEQIRIVLCREDDDFCEEEIIVFHGRFVPKTIYRVLDLWFDGSRFIIKVDGRTLFCQPEDIVFGDAMRDLRTVSNIEAHQRGEYQVRQTVLRPGALIQCYDTTPNGNSTQYITEVEILQVCLPDGRLVEAKSMHGSLVPKED